MSKRHHVRHPWAVDRGQRTSGQCWLYCHACGGTFAYDPAAMSSVEAGQRHWLVGHSKAFRDAVRQMAVDMHEVVYREPPTIVETDDHAARGVEFVHTTDKQDPGR